METLKPNMYVRTKKGMIAKIVSKENGFSCEVK